MAKKKNSNNIQLATNSHNKNTQNAKIDNSEQISGSDEIIVSEKKKTPSKKSSTKSKKTTKISTDETAKNIKTKKATSIDMSKDPSDNVIDTTPANLESIDADTVITKVENKKKPRKKSAKDSTTTSQSKISSQEEQTKSLEPKIDSDIALVSDSNDNEITKQNKNSKKKNKVVQENEKTVIDQKQEEGNIDSKVTKKKQEKVDVEDIDIDIEEPKNAELKVNKSSNSKSIFRYVFIGIAIIAFICIVIAMSTEKKSKFTINEIKFENVQSTLNLEKLEAYLMDSSSGFEKNTYDQINNLSYFVKETSVSGYFMFFNFVNNDITFHMINEPELFLTNTKSHTEHIIIQNNNVYYKLFYLNDQNELVSVEALFDPFTKELVSHTTSNNITSDINKIISENDIHNKIDFAITNYMEIINSSKK